MQKVAASLMGLTRMIFETDLKKNAVTCVTFVQFLNTHRRRVEETNCYVMLAYSNVDIISLIKKIVQKVDSLETRMDHMSADFNN